MTTTIVPAVEMRGITKRFGDLVANDGVDFTLARGQIHGLLGENGAGKTTLMRTLYGLYHADEGEIRIHGEPAELRSPRDAIAHGVGMVTQHFALVPPLTVTENVILGSAGLGRLNLDAAHRRVAAAAEQFGIEVEPRAIVGELSVGQRQRVEILKALYRRATVLILDEPTAVLVPQEVDGLFASLRRLQGEGVSVIFISHKLNEVMEITDRVTVLRAGRAVGTIETARSTQADLARLMVGRETFGVRKSEGADASLDEAPPALRLVAVSALDDKRLPVLKRISLNVRAGEIVGLAGVSGNGQAELAEVLAGTRPASEGRILLGVREVTNVGPAGMMAAGMGRIPEDRHKSVVPEMTVAQNMALEHLGEFAPRGLLNRRAMRRHAEALIAEYQIKAAPGDRIRTLSGGNMQKVILARVLERHPAAIVVAQPTRGLDVGATEYVRRKLLEQRARGAAILLISEDLDEILALADRIAVIYEGEIVGEMAGVAADVEKLGLLMSGVRGGPRHGA